MRFFPLEGDMTIRSILAGILLSAFFAGPVLAKGPELVLDKLRLDIHYSQGDSACDELMHIRSGSDVPDMRHFDCYARSGKYTMVLSGPAGTTVTLFGNPQYGKERGYLVITKKDDKPIWILNLENFPDRQWFANASHRQSGAYDAFYRQAPIFKRNVTSVKWGKWWEGEKPNGNPDR